jgi:hypothetical protein
VLSRVQREEFDRLGFVRVPGLVPASDATRMCDRLWGELERRHGIRRDDPDTWRMVQPRRLQALRRDGAFDALGSPALRGIADQLLGPDRWELPPHWGDPLPVFPCRATRWTLATEGWHIDWPARGAPEPLFALKLLAFIAPVVEGGGGTVVLAGSHVLVTRLAAASPGGAGHSVAVRSALARRHIWLADLWSRRESGDGIRRLMLDGGLIDGTELRVVELTGTPGDVVLLHPWLFHAPAPNCTAVPRMVVGHNLNTPAGRARFASRRPAA